MTFHYAMCNELFEGWPLERVCAFLAEVGYEGVELTPYTLCGRVTDVSAAERRRIARTVRDAGLACTGLHWLLARTEGLQLNAPDPAVRAATEAYLVALVDFCADVDGHVLVFGSPQQRSLRPGWSREEAWRSSVEILRHVGERAAQRGVVFCVEALAAPATDYITTVDEAVALVRSVDHAGLQMIVDMRAMSADPRPLPEQIRLAAPYIRHVHANDPNGLGPGMGALDIRPALAALRAMGYSGYVSVEAFAAPTGPERLARESLANLRAAEG